MKKLFTRIASAGSVALAMATPLASKALVVQDVGTALALGSANPEEITISIVNWVLGLLALIAVILVLIGGFMWMTAGGNEDKIGRAKKLLVAAVTGLVIILAAWGISIYAINILGKATGSGSI